ncbi:hypothetical protein ASPFODRAFT_50082 [Aspergillus luchuensis CBS 106.47]|uniref:Uncharacterized protein n=1 Tax=Aspergillus luchuensis (strain CBS 106.47) TaxID=1137211 RepID=A0A1M3T9M2_ASPLC|nr:hypothetical protein ASPFODRAFT_50082 [Aspergillus luchuensis CBS 106.47]
MDSQRDRRIITRKGLFITIHAKLPRVRLSIFEFMSYFEIVPFPPPPLTCRKEVVARACA